MAKTPFFIVSSLEKKPPNLLWTQRGGAQVQGLLVFVAWRRHEILRWWKSWWIYVYFHTYIHTYIHIYIYMVPAGGRQTPLPYAIPPANNHPAWGGQPSTTIWQDLICCTGCTYMLASATYALHNGIPPCSSLLPKICPYNLFITYSCP